MEKKQISEYNPVSCEHKLPNGLTAWSFQSEEGSNVGGANKVIITVCLLCGEISIGGYRPSKDEKHINHFNEHFNIYHPDAIDAIIKQANFYNEEAKWGRIEASESAAASAVWVKASERTPEGHAADYHWRFAHSKKPLVCVFHISLETLIMEYNNTRARYNFDEVEWLDESGATAGSGKEEAVAFRDWNDGNIKGYDPLEDKWVYGEEEKRVTTSQLYDIYKQSK